MNTLTCLTRLFAGSLLAASMWVAPLAHAGRSCDAKQPSVQAITQGLALAERAQAVLDASGASVVVLARSGQDLGKYGLRYSHLGFAYKQPDGAGGRIWRVLHKLNECGSAVAALYRQGLGDFFLDDLWRFEAAWAVPTPDVQAKLLVLLQDPARATALHQRPYSLVSYAWGQTYQQSNQWAMETLAMAVAPEATTRAKAQAWLQFKGYEPTTLRLGSLARLGGRVSAANVAFDDHPNEKRFSDHIETVTVDSVFAWLVRAQLAAAPEVLR